MADDVEDPVAQAHGELSLARVALAEGDLEHAADHLAGAIAWAPGLPEVHELLAALTARAGGEVADLFPLREPAFIGTVVARAHVTAPADPLGALRMLAQATGFDPEQPWADVSWVRAVDPAGLDPDELARLFVGVMSRLGDPAPAPVAKANEVYLDLARRSLRAHPDHALLHGAAAGLGRRFGDTAEAVRWGARGHRLHPDKLTSVWYAYALRADGRLDAALKVMRTAWRAAPQEMDLCADMANWLADCRSRRRGDRAARGGHAPPVGLRLRGAHGAAAAVPARPRRAAPRGAGRLHPRAPRGQPRALGSGAGV